MVFKNEKGFTLVEALIAIGISMGSALIVYKTLEDSKKGQIAVENRDEINQLHREVIGKFTDRSVCTSTIVNFVNNNNFPVQIPQIINNTNAKVLEVPFTRGRISLTNLSLKEFSNEKSSGTIVASYTQKMGQQTLTHSKEFTIDLSFKDNKFEGCITKGNLGLDPKDACDLVVGISNEGSSYYYNGKCNFAKAACEQSGREWDDKNLKCMFSEDDLAQFRSQVCGSLGFELNEGSQKCELSQALADEVMGKMAEYVKKNQK